jgi:hypothetical protein
VRQRGRDQILPRIEPDECARIASELLGPGITELVARDEHADLSLAKCHGQRRELVNAPTRR